MKTLIKIAAIIFIVFASLRSLYQYLDKNNFRYKNDTFYIYFGGDSITSGLTRNLPKEIPKAESKSAAIEKNKKQATVVSKQSQPTKADYDALFPIAMKKKHLDKNVLNDSLHPATNPPDQKAQEQRRKQRDDTQALIDKLSTNDTAKVLVAKLMNIGNPDLLTDEEREKLARYIHMSR